MTKSQTTIYKTLHTKQIEQHEPQQKPIASSAAPEG